VSPPDPTPARKVPSPAVPRVDLGLALGLAAVAVASRLPFRARLLPSWDAIQFALALGEYDVVKHQPHPPGYILYVALARLVDAGDPTGTLVGVSVGASALTVFLTYLLAWRLYGRATALVAALGLMASPLFWYSGVVGLTYTTEAALATGLALVIWRMRHGGPAATVAGALALGLAGGVRQSLLVLFGPLWLGTAWASQRRWRPVAAGAGVLGLTVVAWLVPMMWLTGGPARYLAASRELFDSTIRARTIAGAWPLNAVAVGEALLLGVGLLLPLLAWLAVGALRPGAAWDARAWLFAGWLLPPLGVYLFFHFGQYEYLLAVLPALYILLARGLVGLPARPAAGGRGPAPVARWGRPAAVLTLVIAGHAAFFTQARSIEVPGLDRPPGRESWQTSLLARYRFGLWPYTARGLEEQQAVIRAYIEGVRREFDPRDTILVTELGNRRSFPWFRHVRYYLPEYAVYHLRLGGFSPGYLASRDLATMAARADPEILLPAGARRLVWVVDAWNPTLPRPAGLRARGLPYGRWLHVLDLERRVVEHGGYRLTPGTAVARLR
jgi:hypothetical protein